MSAKTKYKVMIDKEKFKSKEEASKNIPIVKGRMIGSWRSVTLDQLIKYILDGHMIMPAYMDYLKQEKKKIRDGDIDKYNVSNRHWVSQQLFAVDIDNEDIIRNEKTNRFESVKREGDEYLLVDDILRLCESSGFAPVLIYETYSHTSDHAKYRVMFKVDKLIKTEDERLRIMRSLLQVFEVNGRTMCDAKCIDAGRIFFGGKGVAYKDPKATCSVKQLMELPITYDTIFVREALASKAPKILSKSDLDSYKKRKVYTESPAIRELVNHDWVKFKQRLIRLREDAEKLVWDCSQEGSTKSILALSLKNKDSRLVKAFSDLPESSVSMRGIAYFRSLIHSYDIAELFEYPLGETISCILPNHEDKSPSAMFSYHKGVYSYKCYSHCMAYGVYYDLLNLFEVFTGLSTRDSLVKLAELLEVDLKSTWQEEKRNALLHQASVFFDPDELDRHSVTLRKHMRRSNLIGLYHVILFDAMDKIPDITETGDDKCYHMITGNRLSKLMNNLDMRGSSIPVVRKNLHLLAGLGLINIISDEKDISIVRRANRIRDIMIARTGNVAMSRPTVIEIPLLSMELIHHAESVVKRKEDLGFVGRAAYSSQGMMWFDEKQAREQYVQKELEFDKRTVAFYERAEIVAKELLEKQGYFAPVDLLNHKRTRRTKRKKELLEVITPKLSESLGLKITRYSSYYKELYQISQATIEKNKLNPGTSKLFVPAEDVEDKNK